MVGLRLLQCCPARLALFIASEVRHWCAQGKAALVGCADALGARTHASRPLQLLFDILSTFGQQWSGDVTILNSAFTAEQVMASISNPTPADLALLHLAGARATWAALPVLRAALAPTAALERAVGELRRQARGAARLPTHGSAYSFDKMRTVEAHTEAQHAQEAWEPGVLLTPRGANKRGSSAALTHAREE